MSRLTTFKYIILIIAFAGTVFQCKQSVTTTDKKIAKGEELVREFEVLTDSIDAAWNSMIADDDEKHQYMKRLLLEVSYTNNYDKDAFEKLNNLVDSLKAMRYDQYSMSNSESIDAYDSATFVVTDMVFQYARSHPRYADFPLMEELIGDINEKNDHILIYRIHYDSNVKERNAFIENNAKKLKKANPDLKLEKMPLFELPA